MYLAYVSETDSGASIPVGKWKDLFDGIATGYTDLKGNGCLWNGMLQSNPEISPIACYIYSKYLGSKVSTSTITGEKQVVVENANNVNLSAKIVGAWNDMVKLNWLTHKYLVSIKDGSDYVWPEFREYDQRMKNYWNGVNEAYDNLYSYTNSLGL